MKRDDDLIRELLFEAESSDDPLFGPFDDEDETGYAHAILLCDAGFFHEVHGGIFRLTNQGHDYLAAIRDDGIWQKTKEAASTAGGVGLGVMKDIAVAYAKQELSTQLGLSL